MQQQSLSSHTIYYQKWSIASTLWPFEYPLCKSHQDNYQSCSYGGISFPKEDFSCPCGLYPIELRRYILHECRRFNKYWNLRRNFIGHFYLFLTYNANAFSFVDINLSMHYQCVLPFLFFFFLCIIPFLFFFLFFSSFPLHVVCVFMYHSLPMCLM